MKFSGSYKIRVVIQGFHSDSQPADMFCLVPKVLKV